MVESLFDFQWYSSQTGLRLSDCLQEIRCKCLIFSGFVLHMCRRLIRDNSMSLTCLILVICKLHHVASIPRIAKEKKGTPRPSSPMLEC